MPRDYYCTHCERHVGEDDVYLEVAGSLICDLCAKDKETFGVSDKDFLGPL